MTATDLGAYTDTDSDIINDLGTDCFVTKPANTEDIIGRIKSILSGAD